MRLLILGSKEYPIGTNTDDALPSGGIEVYIQGLVSHLAMEHELKVITRRFSTTQAHEKNQNIEIFRVRWLKGFFFRNISFNFMAFLKALKLDFDIIHTHGPIATFFGLILSGIKRTPIISTPHGLALEQPQYNRGIQKFFSCLEKFIYRRTGCVIFSSEEEKKGFKDKLKFLPKKHRIIPPGVDIKRFESADGQRIKKEFDIEDKSVICYVGRLIKVKGLRYLIEAIRHVEGSFQLLIVGGGIQRKELETTVSRLKLDNIIFTGQRADIPDILAASDIFVLPSLSEGMPIALIEAMAAGKACVVTDIGLPVENKKDAVVVKAADAEALGEALKTLLNNRELRKKLGMEAKKKAAEMFSWERASEAHSKLFEELVSKPFNRS